MEKKSESIIIFPNDSNVKKISRTMIIDNTAWLVHSGSAIEFYFSGYYLEVKIKSDGTYQNESIYQPRFAILVNDKILHDLIMDESEKIIKVINEPNSKEDTLYKIKIIKLSEELRGSVGVNEIKIQSHKENVIKPTEEQKLKIEFIGDSITCGYGIENKSREETFSTKTENFLKTYAYLVSKDLQMDYYIMAVSGYGIVSGSIKNPEGRKETQKLIPPFYDKLGKFNGFDKYKWNFEENKVDLILLNLGTNDFTYVYYSDEVSKNREKEFREGYQNFLKMVRKLNPEAYILCTYGMMGGHKLYPFIEEAIKNYKEESKDTKISCFLCPKIDEKDGYGAMDHPNEITNLKNSKIVTEKIKEILKDMQK